MQVRIAQAKLGMTDLSCALKLGDSDKELSVNDQSAKRMVHGLAPAQGLILAEVHYPFEAVQKSMDMV
jgi:hypothetical protein